jgi:hypothetical protein
MFLSEDVTKAIAFGDFVKKHAKWSMSTEQAIELTKQLAWYNGLVRKIDEHVLELKRTFEAPKHTASVEAAAAPDKAKGKK